MILSCFDEEVELEEDDEREEGDGERRGLAEEAEVEREVIDELAMGGAVEEREGALGVWWDLVDGGAGESGWGGDVVGGGGGFEKGSVVY